MMADGTNAKGNSASTVEESHESGSKKRFSLRESVSEVKAIVEQLSGVDGVDSDKVDTLHKHYQLLVRDYKRLERRQAEGQKKLVEVTQHRDIIQNEHSRVTQAKMKLENLCRELQKHCKAVAEESRQRQKEEDDKRKEVTAKFQTTINEITSKMQEHHQRNVDLQTDNIELTKKLKEVTDEYQARDEHMETLLKKKTLEVQLSEARLAQQTVASAQEKESSLAERQFLIAETLEQQKRFELLSKQESDLRGQLSLYSDKFEEFQSTLTKSNHAFASFKKEMDKMSKTISSQEKELFLWRSRFDKCHKSLHDMTQAKQTHEANEKTLKMKNEKLEKLCRALQTERNELRSKSKQAPPDEIDKDGPEGEEKKEESTESKAAEKTDSKDTNICDDD